MTSLYVGPWAGAALIAGGNSILTQGFTNGFGNISRFDVGTSSIMGGITGYAGGQLGNYLQKPLTSPYGNISSPVLREMLTQGSVGIGTGFTLNTAMAKINGASWGDALSSGVDGATWGAVTGLSSGAVKGFRYARENKISTWSGKAKGIEQEFLPDNVFSTKAPLSTTPGTRELEGIYINDQGKVQPWKAAYDQFGRQYERTDWNAGNIKQGIPDTHFHQRIYLPNGQVQRIDHIPGIGPNTKK